jgi:hypothetical protein
LRRLTVFVDDFCACVHRNFPGHYPRKPVIRSPGDDS